MSYWNWQELSSARFFLALPHSQLPESFMTLRKLHIIKTVTSPRLNIIITLITNMPSRINRSSSFTTIPCQCMWRKKTRSISAIQSRSVQTSTSWSSFILRQLTLRDTDWSSRTIRRPSVTRLSHIIIITNTSTRNLSRTMSQRCTSHSQSMTLLATRPLTNETLERDYRNDDCDMKMRFTLMLSSANF